MPDLPAFVAGDRVELIYLSRKERDIAELRQGAWGTVESCRLYEPTPQDSHWSLSVRWDDLGECLPMLSPPDLLQVHR